MTISFTISRHRLKQALLGATALLTLALAGGGASAENAEPAHTGSVASSETEVERFCSNIADAARDRRYVLQAKELETLSRRSTSVWRCSRKSAPNTNPG
jgi:flagellar motility protein MotE (MotC chaperone)